MDGYMSNAITVEVRAHSFDSLREEIECLLEMNQEVVVILECNENWGMKKELFELVKEHFHNSLQTLNFCNDLEKCLKLARDSQSLIIAVLQQFDEETEVGGSRYVRTLEELKNFKAAGRPFTDEFFRVSRSVYTQQILMSKKLQLGKNKLDKKLKCINLWRKGSSIIFVTTSAAVLVCSVVAAARAAPPVAAALVAAFTSNPISSVGKWVDSLWKNYDNALKWQKEVMSSMRAGTRVAIKGLENIRVLVDRLKIDIAALLQNADFAIEEEGAVKIGIEEIKKKLGVFMKNVEDLEAQADLCSRDIKGAKKTVLQRIIKKPNN